MNEQYSPSVYGLFLADTDQDVLLGLYNLEGEADAAKMHFIAEEVADFSAEKQTWARKEYMRDVSVKRLALGQVPSFRFARH